MLVLYAVCPNININILINSKEATNKKENKKKMKEKVVFEEMPQNPNLWDLNGWFGVGCVCMCVAFFFSFLDNFLKRKTETE